MVVLAANVAETTLFRSSLTINGPNFPIVAVLDARPRRGRLMSGKMKLLCRKIVLYGIVVGLGLTACTDFKKDFLCRPEGHCVNAADGGTGSN
jgi:hypothetical protein